MPAGHITALEAATMRIQRVRIDGHLAESPLLHAGRTLNDGPVALRTDGLGRKHGRPFLQALQIAVGLARFILVRIIDRAPGSTAD